MRILSLTFLVVTTIKEIKYAVLGKSTGSYTYLIYHIVYYVVGLCSADLFKNKKGVCEMRNRRMHMIEIARYYQRLENRAMEKKRDKEKPKGFLKKLFSK